MESGDYAWVIDGEKKIVIERKSVADFVNSVRDGRLETQLINLEQYDEPYLFIHGNFKSLYYVPYAKQWKTAHTVGSLCSVAARYNVKMIQFDTAPQLYHAIFKIKEMVGKGKKVKSVKHKKVKSSTNPLYDIYLSLPGVGDKRAQKLLEAYPKLSDLIADYKNNALKIKLPKVTLEALNFL